MVSTTPSGGWLQSNPVIPGLGFPLNSRAQMFWLQDGQPRVVQDAGTAFPWPRDVNTLINNAVGTSAQ